MIDEQTVAVRAAHELADVIDRVKPEQWDEVLPPSFKTMANEPQTLREVVNYHAYDDAWIPDMLAGRTMAEVGDEKWKGDLLGTSPATNYRRLNDSACIAIEELDDPERTVHCSFGDYSAQQYLLQVISFRGLRAYDIAKALGFDTTLSNELVEGMTRLLVPMADEFRKYGVYGPAIEVPRDATPQQRLLGALGYD